MDPNPAATRVRESTAKSVRKPQHLAQTSVEFLSILAIAVVVIMIIVILAQGQINTVQNIKSQADAKNSILDLSSAAREVYAQGEGSRKLVFIQLPGSYESDYSAVGNNSIRIRVAGTDYVSAESFYVHGYLPTSAGGHWVWVISEGSRVRIGDAMLELDKNWIYVVMNADTTSSTSFRVKNIWIRNFNVSTVTSWTSTDVTMNGVPLSFSLAADGSNTITLNFVSNSVSGGLYTGQISLIADDGSGSTDRVEVPVTVDVVPSGLGLPSPDTEGPLVVGIYQIPTPAIKLSPLTIFVNATDAQTGNHTISSCTIDHDNVGDWQPMLPADGVYDQVQEISSFEYDEGFLLGPHTIRTQCTDSLNFTGPMAYYYFNVSEADTLGPIVISMNHTDYPTTLSNITMGAVATDTYTGSNVVQSCQIKVDTAGLWTPALPDDGEWNSSTEAFHLNVGTLPVGFHWVFYQCTDSLGNIGGIYNDSFGIVDVDLMLVLDRSGSMAAYVTNAVNSNTVSTSSSSWTLVKTLTVNQKNGNLANLSVELSASSGGCTASYNATVNGNTIANGSKTGTGYSTRVTSVNVTNFTAPYSVQLWLKRDLGGCTASNRVFSLQQRPTKMNATQTSASSFLDVAGSNIQAGLVSFSSSATLDRTMAMMDPANQQALKNAINALVPSGGTCIECGLKKAADELVSSRARPNANKVIVLLTDGVSNYGDSVTGSVYCRDRNITVFTIGFGSDVDATELTNIALLTYGKYYFAPDAETLSNVFQSIGRN